MQIFLKSLKVGNVIGLLNLFYSSWSHNKFHLIIWIRSQFRSDTANTLPNRQYCHNLNHSYVKYHSGVTKYLNTWVIMQNRFCYPNIFNKSKIKSRLSISKFAYTFNMCSQWHFLKTDKRISIKLSGPWLLQSLLLIYLYNP